MHDVVVGYANENHQNHSRPDNSAQRSDMIHSRAVSHIKLVSKEKTSRLNDLEATKLFSLLCK